MTIRQPLPRVDAAYRSPALPHDIEFHLAGCECHHCRTNDDRLTFAALGNLALLAVLVGTAIAFVIDPHGALAALRATVGL